MKDPKKIQVKVGKRALRSVPVAELDRVAGGLKPPDPKCGQSPPPTAASE